MQRVLSILLIAGLSIFLIGCEKGPSTVSVSITITQKGNAIEGATVVATASDGSGNSASAVTNASGVAALQTPGKGAGALPGEYQVAVTKWEDGKTVPAPSEDDPNATMVEQNNVLPEKYASPATSGFALTVGPKGTTETFNIE